MENKKNIFIISSEYLLQLHQGIFQILIGAILPMMKISYDLSYEVSGYIVSAMNIGQVAGGLLAGFAAIRWGIKKSNVTSYIAITLGLLIAYITRNPLPLIIGFCMVGMGKGATANYGNYLMNALPGNRAFKLNGFHAAFAVGALASPLIVMACTSKSTENWNLALLIVLIFSAVVTICICFQDLSHVSPMERSGGNTSLAFLKEYVFIMVVLIMFCYQAIECTIMGWMTSYYVETGIINDSSSQLFTSILWASVLVGRLISTAVSSKIRSTKIILILSASTLAFLILLLNSNTYALILISTIGIGLSLSGIYANIVASAGDLFLRYAISMSMYFTIMCLGGTIWPIIVGYVAEHMNIHAGMATTLIPAIAMLLLCIFYDRKTKKNI